MLSLNRGDDMKSGIYIIKNLDNGKIYVGQSLDVKRRMRDHKYKLDKGTHGNRFLQRAYNSGQRFSFEVYLYCSEDELDDNEINAIKKFNSSNNKYGYNLELGGNDNRKVSEYVRALKRGANNPMYGKNLSEKHRNAIRESNRGTNSKLNEEKVKDIKIKLSQGKGLVEISLEYGVHVSTIGRIRSLDNWSYVASELNDKLKPIKIKEKSYSEKLIERNDSIKKDFLNGLTPKELTDKYNLGIKAIRKILGLKKVDYEDKKKRAYELKQRGWLVKDIAKELNVHRTTVTEWLKSMLIPR